MDGEDYDTNDINIPPFSSTTQIKIDMLTRLPRNEFMQKWYKKGGAGAEGFIDKLKNH